MPELHPQPFHVKEFIRESNKIEGIVREPTEQEIMAFIAFYFLEKITVQDLEQFVAIIQPGAILRDQFGLDVRVGNYLPPYGDPALRNFLGKLLEKDYDAYHLHVQYEKLHPFTDGNGRSGRALWAWKHRDLSLGFLHAFYYQTLQNSKRDF